MPFSEEKGSCAPCSHISGYLLSPPAVRVEDGSVFCILIVTLFQALL